MVNYFFDSYAVIELIKGNRNYDIYLSEVVTITIFNLAEIYWAALNDLGKDQANTIYQHYRKNVLHLDDETIQQAMQFRKENKKKKFSYTDCIGYVYALRHNMVFLTGDKEFKDMSGVKFVK